MQVALHLQLLLLGAVSAADVAMTRTIGDVMNEVRLLFVETANLITVCKTNEIRLSNSNYVDRQVIEISSRMTRFSNICLKKISSMERMNVSRW